MEQNDIAASADARYQPETPWGPGLATIATAIVLLLSVTLSLAPLLLLRSDATGLPAPLMLASLIISQVVMGIGGLFFAGTRGGKRVAALVLGPLKVSLARAALAVVAMFAVTSAFQAFRYFVLGHDILADMLAMKPLFVWPYWPLAFFTIAVIAPLAEELLFRGFLLSAFANSRFGFWAGVVISTLIWTVLHVQYALPALLLVALMGVIFSLMLRWSGSLRLPIIAHALNNSIAGLYLMFFVP